MVTANPPPTLNAPVPEAAKQDQTMRVARIVPPIACRPDSSTTSDPEGVYIVATLALT